MEVMMVELFLDPLKYDFMVRSLIMATLSGLLLSILGTFTINKNMGFMADAMAHATLPIIAIGVFLGYTISELGFPAAFIIALFLGFVIKNTEIGEDTSIGIIFSSFFALGYILISVLDVTVNLEDLLFGQILAVSSFDVIAISLLSAFSMLILFVFFKQFLFYFFDPIGAEVKNLNVSALNYLFLIVLSFAIVGSIQTVGIVLVLSMLLIPAASAKLITKNFIQSIKLSAVFGLTSSISGLYFSYYLNLPTGPSMSMVATLIFVISFLINKLSQKALT